MNKIKFSSDYQKLPLYANGTQATLIGITTANVKYLKEALPQFIRYDTVKRTSNRRTEYYNLDFDVCIVLTFIHINSGLPFTTIRRYTKQKYDYYKSLEWKTLLIEINLPNTKGVDWIKYKQREEIFNKLMVAIRKTLYEALNLDAHKNFYKYLDKNEYVPVLSVNPKTNTYLFHCYCSDCPCNKDGICCTEHAKLPINLLHEFDGDNIIKQYCG